MTQSPSHYIASEVMPPNEASVPLYKSKATDCSNNAATLNKGAELHPIYTSTQYIYCITTSLNSLRMSHFYQNAGNSFLDKTIWYRRVPKSKELFLINNCEWKPIDGDPVSYCNTRYRVYKTLKYPAIKIEKGFSSSKTPLPKCLYFIRDKERS